MANKGGEKPSDRRAGKRRDRNQRIGTRIPELGYYLIVTDTEETEKIMRKKIILLHTLFFLMFLYGCSVSNFEAEIEVEETLSVEDKMLTDTYENAIDKDVGTEYEITNTLVPNYYNSVSDADETGIYFGGVGGIFKVDFATGVQVLYETPHILGAALYKDFIFSIEYHDTDNGMSAELIRIRKDGTDKTVMTQVSTGSYDLKLCGNNLVITDEFLGNTGLETKYQSYTLDAGGNLTSDKAVEICDQFEIPKEYGADMHFLINPLYSLKYYGYVCLVKQEAMDVNSVWIRKNGGEDIEKVVQCCGNPILTEKSIFYCDSKGETLNQYLFDSGTESVFYEIPNNTVLKLLNYDNDWIYFVQELQIDDRSMLSVLRVSQKDCEVEELFKLQEGNYMSNFNIYDNKCYYILSEADTVQWKSCDLSDFTISSIY